MTWATFNPADKASAVLSGGNLVATISNGGYARLDTFASSGKRRAEFLYQGGSSNLAVWLGNNVAVPFPPNTVDFWGFDGTGYFGHGGVYTGVATFISAADVLGVNWDADLGLVTFDKNGVVIAGQPAWVGIAGTMSVLAAPTTSPGIFITTVTTDPAMFAFPNGYSGFGTAPPVVAGGNFLPLL